MNQPKKAKSGYDKVVDFLQKTQFQDYSREQVAAAVMESQESFDKALDLFYKNATNYREQMSVEEFRQKFYAKHGARGKIGLRQTIEEARKNPRTPTPIAPNIEGPYKKKAQDESSPERTTASKGAESATPQSPQLPYPGFPQSQPFFRSSEFPGDPLAPPPTAQDPQSVATQGPSASGMGMVPSESVNADKGFPKSQQQPSTQEGAVDESPSQTRQLLDESYPSGAAHLSGNAGVFSDLPNIEGYPYNSPQNEGPQETMASPQVGREKLLAEMGDVQMQKKTGQIPEKEYRQQMHKLPFDQKPAYLQGMSGENYLKNTKENPMGIGGVTASLPDPRSGEYEKDEKNPALSLFSYRSKETIPLSHQGNVKFVDDLATWYKGKDTSFGSLAAEEQQYLAGLATQLYAFTEEDRDKFLRENNFNTDMSALDNFDNVLRKASADAAGKMGDGFLRLTGFALAPLAVSGDADYRSKTSAWNQEVSRQQNPFERRASRIATNPRFESDLLLGKLPQALGSTVPFMLASLTGSTALTASLGGMLNAESQYQDAIASGADYGDALNAFFAGMPTGALEGVLGAGSAKFWARAAKRAGEKVSAPLVRAMKAGTREGAEEAMQESITQMLNNLSAEEIYDFNRELSEGLGESAEMGFLAGAVLGALPGTLSAANSAKRVALRSLRANARKLLPASSETELPTSEPLTQDTPTQDAPTQDTPTQDAPTQDTPTQDTPTQEAPTQEAPLDPGIYSSGKVKIGNETGVLRPSGRKGQDVRFWPDGPGAPKVIGPKSEVEASPSKYGIEVQEAPAQEAPAQEAPTQEAPLDPIGYSSGKVKIGNETGVLRPAGRKGEDVRFWPDGSGDSRVIGPKSEVEASPSKYGIEVQDAPAQDAPAQDAPAQDAPAQDAPAQDAPAQDAPAQDAPAQEAPAQEAPAQEAPAQEAPAQEAPAEEALAEEAPAQEDPTNQLSQNEQAQDPASAVETEGTEDQAGQDPEEGLDGEGPQNPSEPTGLPTVTPPGPLAPNPTSAKSKKGESSPTYEELDAASIRVDEDGNLSVGEDSGFQSVDHAIVEELDSSSPEAETLVNKLEDRSKSKSKKVAKAAKRVLDTLTNVWNKEAALATMSKSEKGPSIKSTNGATSFSVAEKSDGSPMGVSQDLKNGGKKVTHKNRKGEWVTTEFDRQGNQKSTKPATGQALSAISKYAKAQAGKIAGSFEADTGFGLSPAGKLTVPKGRNLKEAVLGTIEDGVSSLRAAFETAIASAAEAETRARESGNKELAESFAAEINRLVRGMSEVDSLVEELATSEEAETEGDIDNYTDTTPAEGDVIEEDAPQTQEEKIAAMLPGVSVRSIKEVINGGIASPKELMELAKEISDNKGEIGDRGLKLLANYGKSRLRNKANTLISTLRAMHKKGGKQKEEQNRARGEVIRKISDAISATAGKADSIVSRAKASHVRRDDRTKKGAVGLRMLADIAARMSALADDAASIREAISVSDIMEQFKEAISDPKYSEQYPNLLAELDSIASMILGLDVFSDQDAKLMGFKDSKTMAEAIASQLLFGDGAIKPDGRITFAIGISGSMGPSSANRIFNFAQQMYNQQYASVHVEAQRAKAGLAAANVDASLSNGQRNAAAGTFLFNKLKDYLQKALPSIKLNMPVDMADFAQALAAIDPMANPYDHRGFYYDGQIWISPYSQDAETLLHEYAHVWVYLFKNTEPAAYAEMSRQIRESPEYQFPGYDHLSPDRRVMEAWAQIIGRVGSSDFDADKGSRYDTMIQKILRAVLGIFGQKVKSVDLTKATINDFLSMALRDMLSGQEIASITDLSIPGFEHLSTQQTKLKKASAEDIASALAAKNDVMGSGLNWAQVARSYLQDSRLYIYIAEKRIHAQRGTSVDRKSGPSVYQAFGLIKGRANHRFDQLSTILMGDGKLLSREARQASRDASILGRYWNQYGISAQDINNFLYALHASERNEYVTRMVNERNEKKLRLFLIEEGMDSAFVASMTLDEVIDMAGRDIGAFSGMTDEQASAIIDRVNASGKRAIYDAAEAEIREKIMKPINDLLEESGIWSKKERERVEGTFKHYVPLYVKAESRVVDGFIVQSGTDQSMKGASVRQKKRIKGTEKYAHENRIPPLTGLMMKAHEEIIKAEKNMVLRQLADLLSSAKGDHMKAHWIVRNAGTQFRMNYKGEPILSGYEQTPDGAVAFWENGQLRFIETLNGNSDLALAVNGNKHIQYLLNTRPFAFLRSLQNIRRNLLTTWNVAFAPFNFGADYLTAMTLMDAVIDERAPGWGQRKGKSTVQVPRVMAAIKLQAKGQRSKNEKTNAIIDAITEMQEQGGTISWIDFDSAGRNMAQYQKDIEKANQSGRSAKVLRYTDQAGKAIHNSMLIYNQMMEQTMRVAAYMRAKEAGLDPAVAADAALNITVNFNRKGHAGALINTLYLFSNASIQGTHNMLRHAKKSPKIIGMNLAAITLGSMAMSAMNDAFVEALGGDDDNEDGMADGESYKNILDAERRNQLIVVNPFNVDSTFQIRLGYGMNVFYHAGHMIYKYLKGESSATHAASEIAETLFGSMVPLAPEFGGLSYALTPDFLKSSYEMANNIQFPGKPIRKEGYGGQKIRPSLAHFESVSGFSKGTAYWLAGNYPGGEGWNDQKNEPMKTESTIEVNPEHMDYFFQQAFGGVGRIATQILSTGKGVGEAISYYNSEDPRLVDAYTFWRDETGGYNDIPIMSRFFSDNTRKDYRSYVFLRGAEDQAVSKPLNAFQLRRLQAIKSMEAADKRANKKSNPNISRIIDYMKEHEVKGRLDEEQAMELNALKKPNPMSYKERASQR